ncbi:hypothetical protein [Sphingomonas sp. LM7]|uniref:hypothetical protein n=1 Tax=Sphingomonas sp. LM7 TaxID=1938607 RepID=UPI000983DC3B|nr:hypothetical protein [Sphingomonas sp. LM7]AQR72321.1 hypothetical protein BXU08_00350 [Sphingomonas sp. LM7]
MSEGSGRPLRSSGVRVTAPPHESAVEIPVQAPRERIPAFPAERAERGIELLSRFAGPMVFFAAIGGILWWMIK